MRIFLAIEFTNDIKEYLYKIQQIVVKDSTSGKFTHKENFHLTLKFIGEIKDNELSKLVKALDNTVLSQREFKMNFNNIGQFSKGNKKIVWIGIEQNQFLDLLYSNLEVELEKQGYPKEYRKFVPHITLGREIVLAKEFEKIQEQVKIENMEMNVDKISIMESTRINGKLTYVPIYVRKFS